MIISIKGKLIESDYIYFVDKSDVQFCSNQNKNGIWIRDESQCSITVSIHLVSPGNQTAYISEEFFKRGDETTDEMIARAIEHQENLIRFIKHFWKGDSKIISFDPFVVYDDPDNNNTEKPG